MDYDVIIIGAGMAGLAAGIRLAMYDRRVLLLERHYAPGGLNSYYHRHGRPFDVGLHAMTNYVPRGTRRAPLTKLLRQLRIPYEAFRLCPQIGSEIRFPGVTLRFANDFEDFRQSVHETFPSQREGFDRLVERIEEHDELSLDARPIPSRPVLEEFISDPLLIDMLYCPLMYYGSPEENEMEFGQFCIMFKSIFKEGFARPEGGVRTVIDALLARFREEGGELRLRSGVRRILTRKGRAVGVELQKARGVTKLGRRRAEVLAMADEPGEVIEAPVVLSTAGYPETLALIDDRTARSEEAPPGRMSFVESIMVLDAEPRQLGIEQTIVFYNDSDRFDYRRSDDDCDLRSGVICCPNNYAHAKPLPEGLLRVTSIANYDRWAALEKPEPYASAKRRWLERQQEKVASVLGGDFRAHVVADDVFTPTTIHHFTDRIHGAVYGSPRKVRSGRTPVAGLYVCGTDQGFLGIVGAMLSGISIANARVLMAGS